VHSELDHSPSRVVRNALIYPPVREPNPRQASADDYEDEDLPI